MQQTYKFKFPVDLKKGLNFQGISEIQAFLSAEEKKCEHRVENLYKWEYTPNKSQCRKLRLKCRCKGCSAFIGFYKYPTAFRVGDFKQEHTHNAQSVLQDNKIKKVSRAIINYDEKFRQQMQTENIKTFGNFSEILKERKYKVAGIQEGQDYPEGFCFSSSDMRRNYGRYGEVLYFDMTQHEIYIPTSKQLKYQMGVFYVIDTNLRMLICGIAIMASKEEVTVASLFYEMLRILHVRPMTIITTEDPEICNAVSQLEKKKLFKGSHILDPWDVLRNIRSKMKGDKKSCEASMLELKKAIFTRNLQQFATSLSSLLNDSQNIPLYEQFAQRSNKICYCQLPKSFIGMRKFSRQRIGIVLHHFVPYHTTLSQLVTRLEAAEKDLNIKSYEEEDMFEEQIEEQFRDGRIKHVREHFQRNVFQRFLENFIDGMDRLLVTDKIVDEAGQVVKFSLIDMKFNKQLTIQNWKCPCDEVLMTGIPCCHLIACARTVEDKGYSELFNERWLKERTHKKQDVVKKQKKKKKHRKKTFLD